MSKTYLVSKLGGKNKNELKIKIRTKLYDNNIRHTYLNINTIVCHT